MMRKIMKFDEFLNESLSEVLFHYTKPAQAVSIINGNSFALLPAVTDERDADLNRGKMYFMSFARSGTKAGYFGSMAGTIAQSNYAVRLVIDGVKLRAKVKGGAVDYLKDYDFRNPGHDEMEDRVFSDKRLVGGARTMIKEVHAFAEPADSQLGRSTSKTVKADNENINKINDLKELCEQYGITFKFFTNHKDFDFAVPKKLAGTKLPGRKSEDHVGTDKTEVSERVEDAAILLAWLELADRDATCEHQDLKKDLKFLDKTEEWMRQQVKDKKEDILAEDKNDAASWLHTLFMNHRKYTGGYMNAIVDRIVKTMKEMKTNTVVTFAHAVLIGQKATA